jgi:ribulose-5-phosphate 4-epimerase/fuculose-1-phosphate aldolase
MAQTESLMLAEQTVSGTAERQARIDLAAAYRLSHMFELSDLVYTHISVRVQDAPDQFLINGHGMLFDEITASSLLKVTMEGEILTQPNLGFGLHPAGFVIHSALYRARADIGAVMHSHTTAGLAVASLKCGLLPLTQTSHRFYGRVSYHDFNGPERDPHERDKLAASLGANNVAILRNHGLLTVGPTIGEAFNYMYGMERSCRAQLAAMACNTELNMLDPAVIEKSCGLYAPGVSRRYGPLEWKGLLRRLDRIDPSYRD